MDSYKQHDIERLCALVNHVMHSLNMKNTVCGCFCRISDVRDSDYCSPEEALAFIENATQVELLRLAQEPDLGDIDDTSRE